MKAYRYVNDKSDKFWRIDSLGADLLVHFGKSGTIGRFQLKELGSEEFCQKELEKLIKSKTKKGYTLEADFDPCSSLYLDDQEMGLHPLSSHPKFREHFSEEFYYSCVEEEAPFGSDTGADTLGEIEEQLRKSKNFDFASFSEWLLEAWDMSYILPTEGMGREELKTLLATKEYDLLTSFTVIASTAFAQIKITGKVDPHLKGLALLAMQHTHTLAELLGYQKEGERSVILAKMIQDLESFE